MDVEIIEYDLHSFLQKSEVCILRAATVRQGLDLIFKYYVDKDPEELQGLRDDIAERVKWKRNPLDPRYENEYLFSLMDEKRFRFRVLRDKENKSLQGIITYDSNRIYMLYLRREVENSKIAAFELVKEALSEMKKDNPDYIFSTLDRWSNVMGYEHISNALGLMGFLQDTNIEYYLPVGNRVGEKPEISKKDVSFQSFRLSEHKDRVLELALMFPEPVTELLFPESLENSEEKRKKFIESILFGSDPHVKWTEIEPESSILAEDNRGNCIGYLLFNKGRSRIMGIRVHPDYAGKNISAFMIWKLKKEQRERHNCNIYLSIHPARKGCLKWIEKSGFRSITDFTLWGWSPYQV
jgi:hypothetical protein